VRRFYLRRLAAPLLLLFITIAASPAVRAQISGDSVKIGVLTDLSGPYAESGGKGSVLAAQLAADDFGGMVRGKPIEILSADHQNKPDIAATIAQRWFDLDKVGAIVDLPVTAIALTIQTLAREKGRTTLITAAAASDLTAKTCTLVSTHWADDTHALTAGAARAVLERGGKTWFFITGDHAFGHALQSEATQVIEAGGGKILGSAKFPTGAPDFSSFLLQAKSSGADVVGLAGVGADLINIIKQANELGLTDPKQILSGFLVYITDVHSLGLQAASNLTFGAGFYWDQSESSRLFAHRFLPAAGTMPTKTHAAVYTAVSHYLTAIDHAGTDDAVTVNKVMRQIPVDYFGRPATVRADGRVLYDLTLYRVKTPSQSKYPWDYYAPVKTIPKEDAFLPMNAACGP
jgi:branched-chain amino acid transport system substrate-binding protein